MRNKLILLIASLICGFTGFGQTLIAKYDFSGGAAIDGSGNGLNGTLNGSVTSAAGRSGVPNTALHFAAGGYVEVMSNPLFDMHSWTISAVVKFDSFYNGSCQENRIVDRATTDDNSPDFMAMGVGDNAYDHSCGIFTPTRETYHGYAARPSGSTTIAASTYIVPGKWYCLTATYGNDTMRTYINGALDEVVYWPDNYMFPSNASLLIGKHIDPAYPYYFYGTMDKVSIWDGTLAQRDIETFCQVDTPCTVKDIQFCSSVISSPYQYTFTPTVSPSSAPVKWEFGDGTALIAPGNNSVVHSYAAGTSSVHICLTVLTPDSQQCSTPYCFDMCMSRDGAKPATNNGIGGSTGIKNAAGTLEQSIGNPFPNPNHAILSIPVTGYVGQLSLTVIGIDGAIVMHQNCKVDDNNSRVTLNTNSLTPGTYYLEIGNEASKVYRQFTKL